MPFLDEVEAELFRLTAENEELRAKLAAVSPVGHRPVMGSSSPLPDPRPDTVTPEPAQVTTDSPQPGSWTSRVTPADVRYKQFNTTRLRPGYDEEEVDAFLDEVEAELFGLTAENEELRAKLAAVSPVGHRPVIGIEFTAA